MDQLDGSDVESDNDKQVSEVMDKLKEKEGDKGADNGEKNETKKEEDVSDDDESDDSAPKVGKKKIIIKKKAAAPASDNESDSGSDDSNSSNKKKKKKIKKIKVKKSKADGKSESPSKKKGKKSKEGGEDQFLASDDDNDSLAEEYAKQKEFDSDEDPYGDEDNMEEEDASKGKVGKAMAVEPDDDVDPDSFQGILKGISKRKSAQRKKKMGDSEKADQAMELLKRMKEAVIRDNKARSKRKPATHKLAMLDDVELGFLNVDMQSTLLDQGALILLGEWLRPSKIDSALPSLTIRTRLIKILPQLNIDVELHLEAKRCELGKVVAFLASNPKETEENRQILRRRMQVWSESIYKRQNKRASMAMQDDDGDAPVDRSPKRARFKQERKGRELAKEKFDDLARMRQSKKSKDAEEKGSYRAVIPQPINFDYAHRPGDNVTENKSGGSHKDRLSVEKRRELEKKLLAVRKKRINK